VAGGGSVAAADHAAAASKSSKDKRGDARIASLDLTRQKVAYGKGRLRFTYSFKNLGGSGWIETLYGAAPFKFADDGFILSVDKAPGQRPQAMVRRYQEFTGEGKRLRDCHLKRDWQAKRDRVLVSLDADCGVKKAPRAVESLGAAAFGAGRGDYSDGMKSITVRYN